MGGRDLDPRDVVAEVLQFLREDAATGQPVKRQVERAVMTIPVKLDGAGRRRLREAARKAGIGIVQFVHEPLAALYAYLRSTTDYRRRLAELDGCRILVFDWGGGTLDLTLAKSIAVKSFKLQTSGTTKLAATGLTNSFATKSAQLTHASMESRTCPGLRGMKQGSCFSISASFERLNFQTAIQRRYLFGITYDVRELGAT